MACSHRLSLSIHQCRRTSSCFLAPPLPACKSVPAFRTIAPRCPGSCQSFWPLWANVAFIFSTVRPTALILFRGVRGSKPTSSYLPALQVLDGRSYCSADSAARLEEEESPTAVDQEGLLEAKRKEFESLRNSVQEFDKEIAKLKELQKRKLMELESLKTETNGLDVQNEVKLGRKKSTRESLDSEGKSSASRRKKTTKETSSVSSSSFSAPVEAGRGESTKPSESIMPLETLGLTEEPENVEIKEKSKKSHTKRKTERKSIKGEDMEATSEGKSIMGESVDVKQQSKGPSKWDHELLEKSKSKSSVSRKEKSDAMNEQKTSIEIETPNHSLSVSEKQNHPSEMEIAQVTLEDSETVERAAGLKRSKRKLCQSSSQYAAENRLLQLEKESTDLGDASSIPGKDNAVIVGESQPGLYTAKSKFDHPWPQWTAFLEHLEEKNYFSDVVDMVGTQRALFKDRAYIKNALMSFGRERDDLFRFLSKQAIRVIVNFGCPSIDRKVVNAAKRLRAQLGIVEGDVCQQCRLKKSCTRAFCLPERQITAVTLDVVRILLPFAENILPDAELHESYPKEVTIAICNLLEELVQLSLKPKESNITKPKLTESFSPQISLGVKGKFDEDISSQNFADWSCPNCAYANFSRNRQCRVCGVFRPMRYPKPGDWECPNPKCRFTNFMKNIVCLECHTERGTHAGLVAGERRVGYIRNGFQDDQPNWGRVDKPIRRSVADFEDEEASPVRTWSDDDNERSWESSRGMSRMKHEEWKPDLRRKGKFDDVDDFGGSGFSEEDDFSDEEDFASGQKSMMGARNPKLASNRWNRDVRDAAAYDDDLNGNTKSVGGRDDWKYFDKAGRRSKVGIGDKDHGRGGYKGFSPDFEGHS
eukprot:c27957_g1_i1 orf=156-2780(+)